MKIRAIAYSCIVGLILLATASGCTQNRVSQYQVKTMHQTDPSTATSVLTVEDAVNKIIELAASTKGSVFFVLEEPNGMVVMICFAEDRKEGRAFKCFATKSE